MKKNKIGRPTKTMDFEQFEKLCKLQCTEAEIMSFFDIGTRDTLIKLIKKHYGKQHTFSTIYEQKRQGGLIAIRRKQAQVAESGNVVMLIWLGKQWLNQKDKHEITSDPNNTITLNYKLKEKDENEKQ